jgi:hypothetical protein
MLDARINPKTGAKRVEKNAITKCTAKHSGYRGLTHAGRFSHGGARRAALLALHPSSHNDDYRE